jgi:hypothetical protein
VPGSVISGDTPISHVSRSGANPAAGDRNATLSPRPAPSSAAHGEESGTPDAFPEAATGTRRVCAAAFHVRASSPVPEEARPPAAL